jgi:membrane-associated phospholipid phosphatase
MTPTLAAPSSSAPARALGGAVRRSEWAVLAFLCYAAALSLLLRAPVWLQYRMWGWNGAILVAYAFLIYFDSVKPVLPAAIARDWLPLAVVLLAYREMGWFAQPHAGALLESRWIVWDRLLLRGGARAAVESLGPVLPSILEIAYSLVYTLAPFSIALLYLTGNRKRVDRFLFLFVLSVLLCYAQFPFWPSEPPRVVFFQQDAPSYYTIFRQFNLWMLGNYGIHTSVFPSAHVAGAFAAAFGLRQAMPKGGEKWAIRLLFAIAALIALATVYGRYHYAADATAGFLIAGIVALTIEAPGLGAIRRRLNSVQLCVLPALSQQPLMRPRLHQPRAVEHQDQVGHAYRREAVRHENGNASIAAVGGLPRGGGIAFEKSVFGLGIERGGRLVENQ